MGGWEDRLYSHKVSVFLYLYTWLSPAPSFKKREQNKHDDATSQRLTYIYLP